jgi:hypothetical protein
MVNALQSGSLANATALRNQGIPFPDPGKPIKDFGSPTLCLLAGENIPANRPIEHDQFSIDGEAGTKLRGATRFLIASRSAG